MFNKLFQVVDKYFYFAKVNTGRHGKQSRSIFIDFNIKILEPWRYMWILLDIEAYMALCKHNKFEQKGVDFDA